MAAATIAEFILHVRVFDVSRLVVNFIERCRALEDAGKDEAGRLRCDQVKDVAVVEIMTGTGRIAHRSTKTEFGRGSPGFLPNLLHVQG